MLKCLFSLIFFASVVQGAQPIPVAVVGSGPAGLGAALVTSRDRIETHIFQGNRLGGPANAVTCLGNWPASVPGKGDVVMKRLVNQVVDLGGIFHDETIVHVELSKWPYLLTTDRGDTYEASAVVFALGARQKTLGIEGESIYMGKGIETYFYRTDGEKVRDKQVVVVGGGVDAVKKACTAAKTAQKVFLIVRGPSLQTPFLEAKVERKGKGKIEVLYNTVVTRICGDGDWVTHVELCSDGSFCTCAADLFLLGIGITPNTGLVQGQLPLDAEGYVLLEGRTQETSIPGVFAAGNATDSRYQQAAISAGDGMKAGYDAIRFLQ